MHHEITISVTTDPFLMAESGSADSALSRSSKPSMLLITKAPWPAELNVAAEHSLISLLAIKNDPDCWLRLINADIVRAF